MLYEGPDTPGSISIELSQPKKMLLRKATGGSVLNGMHPGRYCAEEVKGSSSTRLRQGGENHPDGEANISHNVGTPSVEHLYCGKKACNGPKLKLYMPNTVHGRVEFRQSPSMFVKI